MHLFFVISGFVIAISLMSGGGITGFLFKRFMRLWPALAVCSVITFLALHLIDTAYSQSARVGISGFIPSLTFTKQSFWQTRFGLDGYVDGVYWTLAIEVQFYLWAAVIFAVNGTNRFAERAALTLLVIQFVQPAALLLAPELVPSIISGLVPAAYLHLFAAGILFSEVHRGGANTRILALLAWSFAVSQYIAEDAWEAGFFALIFLLVGACAWRVRAACWLGWRPLALIGVGSYSIYLLHSNTGITLITLLPKGLSPAEYLVAAAGIFWLILMLSGLVFVLVERPSLALARRIAVQAAGGGRKQVLQQGTGTAS